MYLIAAVVIIGLLLGLLTITSYVQQKRDTRVEALARELDYESAKILELGAVSEVYPWNSFTQNFSAYASHDVAIIYLVGDYTTHEAFTYDDANQKTTAGLSATYDSMTDTYTVTLDEGMFSFPFYEGENFYFVITSENNGEVYVATNN